MQYRVPCRIPRPNVTPQSHVKKTQNLSLSVDISRLTFRNDWKWRNDLRYVKCATTFQKLATHVSVNTVSLVIEIRQKH